MNLGTLKPQLALWVSGLLGVDPTLMVWENAPRPRVETVFATLSIVTLGGVGTDENRWRFTTDPAPALNATATVNRNWRMMFQVSVESFDQTPGNGALETAMKLCDAWRLPDSLAFLAAQNIGVSDVKDARQADYPVQGRWISRAITQVKINATSTYVASTGTPTIETVGITSALTDEGGSPSSLQIDGTFP